MRKIWFVTLLGLGAMGALGAQAADVSEGNWEIQVTTTVPGAPPAALTQNQCMRAEDGKNPGRLFGNPGPGCEFLNQSDDGKTFRFEIRCKDQNAAVTGSGELRYAQASMEGELVIRTTAGGKSADLSSRIQARRVGPCK